MFVVHRSSSAEVGSVPVPLGRARVVPEAWPSPGISRGAVAAAPAGSAGSVLHDPSTLWGRAATAHHNRRSRRTSLSLPATSLAFAGRRFYRVSSTGQDRFSPPRRAALKTAIPPAGPTPRANIRARLLDAPWPPPTDARRRARAAGSTSASAHQGSFTIWLAESVGRERSRLPANPSPPPAPALPPSNSPQFCPARPRA